jgi:hypothetical protein
LGNGLATLTFICAADFALTLIGLTTIGLTEVLTALLEMATFLVDCIFDYANI